MAYWRIYIIIRLLIIFSCVSLNVNFHMYEFSHDPAHHILVKSDIHLYVQNEASRLKKVLFVGVFLLVWVLLDLRT